MQATCTGYCSFGTKGNILAKMGLLEYKQGKPCRTYIAPGEWQPVVRHGNQGRTELQQALLAPFLPEGYPHSVTPDFPGVMRWHLAQAMSSYIRGILASHAVFLGLGVGNQAASALSAVFQFFVRDIIGLVGGILFASAAGGNFDANAKQWRLFADVMNNVGLALDLASPLVPGGFLLLASLGSIARAAVGMAAGATHTALTQHFAAANNAADVTAKADARERACNIIGSLIGMALIHYLKDHVLAAWAVFLVLTWVHVWANTCALRCLVLTSLNEARLQLLVEEYTATASAGQVLTPADISQQESLLIPPLRRALLSVTGRHVCLIKWGSSMSQLGPDIQQAIEQQLSQNTLQLQQGSVQAPSSPTKQLRRRRPTADQPVNVEAKPVVALQGGGQLISIQGCGAAADGASAFLYANNKVVEVVLQEGTAPAQSLLVYIAALLLAARLGSSRGSNSQVHDGQVGAASPATRSRTRQQLQPEPRQDPGATIQAQAQALMVALEQAGWQLQEAYLPTPTSTFSW